MTYLGSGYLAPCGIAVDLLGRVYVSDTNHWRVIMLTPNGVNGFFMTTIASGFSYPRGLAVDASYNVYVAKGYSVKRVSPDGGITAIGQGFCDTRAVATDAFGNVYVTDACNAALFVIAPTGVTSTLINGFPGIPNSPWGVAASASGSVYVVDPDNARI